MKTSELINSLHELGYQTEKVTSCRMLVYNKNMNMIISRVMLNEYGQIDTNYLAFPHSPKLLNLLTEYAGTEVNEREDENKYYIHLLPGEDGYLIVGLDSGKVAASSLVNSGLSNYGYKVVFTEDEYNKVQNRYPEYLPKFDKDDPHFIEVQDDEYEEG